MKQWLDDIFIINESGIPYWSQCYGGENCKLYPDHLMQTGILAAFYQFGKEFGQRIIQRVEFDTGTFFFSYEKPIIIIFATERDVKSDVVFQKINQTNDLFLKNFSDKVNSIGINLEDFHSMGELLKKEGIIEYNPMGDIKIVKKSEKKSWWKFWKH